MKRILFAILLSVQSAMSCPYCAGDPSGPDKNSFLIITIAVFLIYIPFYLLFKMAFKRKSFNNIDIDIDRNYLSESQKSDEDKNGVS